MFFFDKKQRAERLPSSLLARLDEARSELEHYLLELSKDRRAQTDPPNVWKKPLEPDVLLALSQLSYGKCAFCERRFSPEDLLAYRFRPPSRAGDGKTEPVPEAYLWTAFNWDNLFPICRDCRPLNSNIFPVRNTRWRPTAARMGDLLSDPNERILTREAPVLLHPGEWNRGLQFHKMGLNGHLPIVLPEKNDLESENLRYSATIEHFGLNRPELVSARKRALQERIALLGDGTVLTKAEMQDGPEVLEFASTLWVFFSVLLSEHRKKPVDRLPTFRSAIKGLERHVRESGFTDTLDRLVESLSRSEDQISVDRPTLSQAAPKERPPSPYHRDFPRLTGISIRNYKSLEEVDLALKPELTDADREKLRSPKQTSLPEAPCLLILGENATGKSSILEALVLACLLPEERNILDLEPRQLTLNPDYLGELDSNPRDTAHVELTFASGPKLSLKIEHNNEEMTGTATAETRPLIFGFGAQRLYGSYASRSPISRVETLFYPERTISNPEDWLTKLQRENPSDIDDVIMALRYLIEIDDDFENIAPRTDSKTGKMRWLINFRRFRDGAPRMDQETGKAIADKVPYMVSQRFDTVSSGYRAVLALVCEVLAGLSEAFPGNMYEARRARAIVVVDEIEAHLHPRWKLTIIDRLRRALPNVTFIFTSHDPLCVRGAVKGEVVVLNRYVTDLTTKDEKLPEMVECVEISEKSEHLTVEQMLNSDLFRLLTTEAENTRTEFAKVADILAKQDRGETLTSEETRLLDAFNVEIRDALPYGDTVIPRLVQDAVAEYIREARNRPSAEHEVKRRVAIDSLKKFLAGSVR